jgi:hypothetical protein
MNYHGKHLDFNSLKSALKKFGITQAQYHQTPIKQLAAKIQNENKLEPGLSG